jgi:hypothetical protein
MPLLSVAIPTFNRHEFLRATLQALRGQARENVELVVVDNCSTTPVEPVVQEALAGSGWSFRVVRNEVNVGLCANILRCFEVAQADWLWALSDDDTVDPHAVATLLETIEKHPDLLFATYSHPVVPVAQDQICESVDSFLLALDSIPRVIFISAALYHRRKLLPYVSLAYNFIDSGAPQTALLLLAGLANPQQKLGYLSAEIVRWAQPSEEQSYSPFSTIGQCRLLLLCNPEQQAHMADLLVKAAPSPIRLLNHLVRDATQGRNRAMLDTILDQYLESYGKIRRGPVGIFWHGPGRWCGRLALRFPGLCKKTVDLLSRALRGRPIVYHSGPVSLSSYQRAAEKAAHTLP